VPDVVPIWQRNSTVRSSFNSHQYAFTNSRFTYVVFLLRSQKKKKKKKKKKEAYDSILIFKHLKLKLFFISVGKRQKPLICL